MSTATAPLLSLVSKKKAISSILTFLFMIGFVASAFSQANHIKKIREIYQDVNKRIAECERNGEDAETFLIETIVNKNNGSYPAVGLYQATVKFYYTYGDREKNPYPDRLLKILVSVNRAARTESSEFLFDEAENLIFYYEKKEEEERASISTAKNPSV